MEVEDPIGHKEGAPALYAFATGITEKPGTETFFRNVAVTPNKAPAPPKEKEAPKEPEAARPAPAAPVIECQPAAIVVCDPPRRLFPRLRGR